MATLRKKNCKGGVIWFVDFRYQDKRYRISTKTSDRKLAELFLKDIEVKIAKDAFGFDDFSKRNTKLAEFFEKFLKFSEATKAKNSFLIDEQATKFFLNFVGNISLKAVTPKIIEEFKLNRLSQVKPASVNMWLRHLKAIFQTAVKWAFLEKNPFKEVSQVKIKGNNLPKFLTKEQVRILLDSIPDGAFKQLILFYLYTGCRRNEGLNLTWDDVNTKSRKITLRETKSGDSRIIPINKRLLAVLNQVEPNGTKLFPFKDDFVTHKFKKYLRSCEIKDSEALSVHSLRHTFASHLVMEGTDLYTVSKLLGHSSVAVTQMYAHLSPDYLRQSVEKLDY